MIKLIWLPSWHAYVVRFDGRSIGMLRCRGRLPFRRPVEFV